MVTEGRNIIPQLTKFGEFAPYFRRKSVIDPRTEAKKKKVDYVHANTFCNKHRRL